MSGTDLYAWVNEHAAGIFITGLIIVVLGVSLKRGAAGRTSISKTSHSNRSVRVGRDNFGTIRTGDETAGTSEPPAMLARFADYASILGLLVGILGLIPLVIGWVAPPHK